MLMATATKGIKKKTLKQIQKVNVVDALVLFWGCVH